MAAVTQRSLDLIQLFSGARHAHEASGASIYGPRLVDWPEWAVDAMTAIEIERVQYENARTSAIAER